MSNSSRGGQGCCSRHVRKGYQVHYQGRVRKSEPSAASCKTDLNYATFLNELLKTLATDLLYASLRVFVCSPNATN